MEQKRIKRNNGQPDIIIEDWGDHVKVKVP